jgi:hypothetical protein
VIERATYRSRQFFTSLRPRVDPVLRDEAYAFLSDGERHLFESMLTRDQQHSLDVYRRLADQHQDRDLLAAALLHDCGKGKIALWHRVAYVLLDAASPSVLHRVVVAGDGTGWRQSLYRCVHHPELGAERARSAGSSERTVQLIRGERTEESREQLAALHAADDAA